MIAVVGAHLLRGAEVPTRHIFPKEGLIKTEEANRIAEDLEFLEFLKFLEL
jgi:hypothetical protein